MYTNRPALWREAPSQERGWWHPCGIIYMNLFIWFGTSMIDQVIVLTCCALIGVMCLGVQLSDSF